MGLDLDIHRSITGLWIEAPPYGYLAEWSPRLRRGTGQLIPLAPGLNVLYGRNGAGKTQLLRAISLAANARMSAHEGFVLQDPKNRKGENLLPADAASLMEIYREQDWGDIDSEVTSYIWEGRSWLAFNPDSITQDRQGTVDAILAEFLAVKTALLTRGMSLSDAFESPFQSHLLYSGRPTPDDLMPPWTMSLVPVILPHVDAPISRRVLAEMAVSLRAVYAEARRLERKFEEEAADPNNTDALTVEQWELLSKWVDEWDWCPLLNRRNIGIASNAWVAEWDVEEDELPGFVGHLALSNPDAAIYLPSIHLTDSQPLKRAEWVSEGGAVAETTIPVLREGAGLEGRDPETAISLWALTPLERSHGALHVVDENVVPKFVTWLDSAVEVLKDRLTFLPSLKGLTHTLERDGSNAKHREAGWLALSLEPKVLAHEGSAAERRWISLAQLASTRNGAVLVIDEPEAGVHRQAEAQLATALSTPAWINERIVVVATHSPEFLNQPHANVLHIDQGVAHPLRRVDRESLDALGLRPSDLLSHINTFLLVEGEHEKIVFEELFSDELRAAGVELLAARGGSNMRDVFESQFLFNLTDAHVVCLLDNTSADHVTEMWKRVRDLAQRGQLIEAREAILRALPGKEAAENKFLSEFLTSAIAHGQHERVTPWGLTQPDILIYLPREAFGLKKPWDVLLAENATTGQSLKPWAIKKYGADFSPEAVRAAAQSLDHIPTDFSDLLFHLQDSRRQTE